MDRAWTRAPVEPRSCGMITHTSPGHHGLRGAATGTKITFEREPNEFCKFTIGK